MREGRVAASVDQNVPRCATLDHESVGPSHKCAEIHTHEIRCTTARIPQEWNSKKSWETDILRIWNICPEMPWNGTWTSNLALTLQLIHWEKEHDWAVKRWAQWIIHAIRRRYLKWTFIFLTVYIRCQWVRRNIRISPPPDIGRSRGTPHWRRPNRPWNHHLEQCSDRLRISNAAVVRVTQFGFVVFIVE